MEHISNFRDKGWFVSDPGAVIQALDIITAQGRFRDPSNAATIKAIAEFINFLKPILDNNTIELRMVKPPATAAEHDGGFILSDQEGNVIDSIVISL